MGARADKLLRAQLADFLDWKSAHVGFDDALAGLPAKSRGVVPKGFAHSIWQVVEHIRLAQHDILDFSRNPRYQEMKWPDDYWPASPVPKSPAVWNRALADYRTERRAMQRLVATPRTDLLAKIPARIGADRAARGAARRRSHRVSRRTNRRSQARPRYLAIACRIWTA